jgi:hypothetical protein
MVRINTMMSISPNTVECPDAIFVWTDRLIQ